MRIESILFPTDFSEPAERALPHVMTMANRFDSNVTVLHVRLPYASDPNRPQYLFVNEKHYSEYVEEQLQRIEKEFGGDRRVSTEVSKGLAPALGILRYAERNAVGAVVMSTHGRSTWGNFLLGTVAEKVVRHARCHVLTVAYGRKIYRDDPSYKKVLVPFDFSERSVEAVRIAEDLACKYEATIQVLHVVSRQPRPGFVELSENLERIAEKARKELSRILDREDLGRPTVQVDIGGSESRASARIARFAYKNDCDLIVMATHGLTGIEHALMGSTTERVVRVAPCPVLTVPGSLAPADERFTSLSNSLLQKRIVQPG